MESHDADALPVFINHGSGHKGKRRLVIGDGIAVVIGKLHLACLIGDAARLAETGICQWAGKEIDAKVIFLGHAKENIPIGIYQKNIMHPKGSPKQGKIPALFSRHRPAIAADKFAKLPIACGKAFFEFLQKRDIRLQLGEHGEIGNDPIEVAGKLIRLRGDDLLQMLA